MIYLFYTSLALAAIISIGIIKAQMAHIKGLKGMYKEESRAAHAYNLTVMQLRAELRSVQDVSQTWAKRAHELNEDLTQTIKQHAYDVEQMRTQIFIAEQYMHRVREQKRRCQRKRKEAKNAAAKN